MKLWKGNDLEGEWDFTVKIDGIHTTYDGKDFISDDGDKLLNINHLAEIIGSEKDDEYEIFCGDLESTKEVLSSDEDKITEYEIFDLEPEIDPRLYLFTMINPSAEDIEAIFCEVIDKGYEGLVLRGTDDERLKVDDRQDNV
jgi:hypothetical protein